MKGLLINVCMGSPFWHVIKLGMETGNEMKQKMKSTFSVVMDIHYNIVYTTTVLTFTDLMHINGMICSSP